MSELSLVPLERPENRREEIRAQVIAFNKEHPEVWGLFCKYTFNRIARGFKHYSARRIWQQIRWDTDKPEYEDGTFKLNNNWTPFYARAFMRKYPEHEGFFRLRKQISEDSPPRGPDRPPPNIDPAGELDERDEWPN